MLMNPQVTQPPTWPPVWSRREQVEWVGQMSASLLWIASVLSYGINSTGDWLQIAAASAWLVANLATLASATVPASRAAQTRGVLSSPPEPAEGDFSGADL
jgi:hypothetical protein